MSQTSTPGGPGHREDTTTRQDAALGPRPPGRSSPDGSRRPRVFSLVVGGILCVLALVFVAGGAWALWKDRVDRDSQGFVSFGTQELRTDQYAIVGDLRGDGPDWLYGSDVLGDARIRATSEAEEPLFIGIARKDDVLRYLEGAGYATIYSFEVTADTTHPGDPPSGPPARESIWEVSMQGTGRQTLLWTPRAGDWSVVIMNADAGADVGVRGDAGAKLPVLPWLAGALLVLGGAAGAGGAWVLVRAVRRSGRSRRRAPKSPTGRLTGRRSGDLTAGRSAAPDGPDAPVTD